MKIRSILFSSIILTTMLACSTSTQKGIGEYVDDSVITAKVKTAILGEENLRVAEINVKTFKGNVQLSGFVDSQAVTDRAGVLARDVPGVKSVENSLQVK